MSGVSRIRERKPASDMSEEPGQSRATPQNVFLIVAVPFGLLFSLLLPPFQSPDENTHFMRAYQISGLRFLPRVDPVNGAIGDYLPASLSTVAYSEITSRVVGQSHQTFSMQDLGKLAAVPLEPDALTFTPFMFHAFFPPVLYLPAAAAMGAGRLLAVRPVLLLYLGRLGNLLVWILLLYQTIRITPVLKWAFALLALMPLMLALASSLSTDGITAAMVFLTIALSLRMSVDEQTPVRRRDLVSFWCICALLPLCKVAYTPVVMLYLLIPPRRLGGLRRYLAFFGMVVLGMLALQFAWMAMTREAYAHLKVSVPIDEQMLFVLSEPLHFLRIVARTLSKETSLAKWIGRLGWLDTPLPEILVWFHLLLLAMAVFREKVANPWPRLPERALCLCVLVASVVFISGMHYLVWNPVGNEAVRGIQQGRYFLPLYPVAFLAVYNPRIRARNAFAIGAAVSLACAACVVAKRYYLGA